MNALIEVKGEGCVGKVLLNPHAIAWAVGCNERCTHVAVMTGADEHASPVWMLECTYDDFKKAWSDALNYDERFGNSGEGVVGV